MGEYDWYIENRTSAKSKVSLSFGGSLQFFVQRSLFFTGQDFRLMFGIGI